MRKTMGVLVFLMGVGSGSAAAQTAWDSPLLLPPRPAPGFGVFLAEMAEGGLGVLGTWRAPGWNYGVRGGIAEGFRDGDVAVFAGLDYTGPVNIATDEFPVDIDWVFGAGVAASDGVRISFPLGLTAGHGFRAESATFTPFITPRVVLDGYFGGSVARSEDIGLEAAVDLGLDLRFSGLGGPLAGANIRFAATVGDRGSLGVGLVFQ